LLSILLDRPLPQPSNSEKIFLSELQAIFREFSVLKTTKALPSETAWLRNMNRLRELVLNGNPREFLRWDVISRTMFVSSADYISAELKYLKNRCDWGTRWCGAIKESFVGHPPPYILYPASSGNLIHHAYHVAQFEEKTKVEVQNIDYVFEFGGGYGSMCRLFHNLGFHGRYILFDLPPFSALQVYFLKNLGLPVQSITEFGKSRTGIVCVSDIQHLKTMLGDPFQAKNRLFIATWSVSEAPIRIRDAVLALTTGFQLFLISYQDRFGEVDNADFFGTWRKTIKNVAWHSLRIEHIPGNNYLFGGGP